MALDRFPLNLISKLPLRSLYAICPTLAFLANHVFHYRKKIIFSNLRNSFPDKSDHEIKKIQKDFYLHLATIIVEALKSRTMSIEELCKRFRLTNPELIEDMSIKHGGALLITPHFGNWEWGISLGDQLKTPCTSFYKTLHNPKANAALLADRDRFKMDMAPVDDAARVLLKNKNSQTSYVVLFDQHPNAPRQTEWMIWLNQPTEINPTPAKLAAKLGYPLIYLQESFPKKGHYEMTAVMIEEHPTKEEALTITKKFMNMLAEQIRQQPSQWLWTHRRWKSTPPENFEADHGK